MLSTKKAVVFSEMPASIVTLTPGNPARHLRAREGWWPLEPGVSARLAGRVVKGETAASETGQQEGAGRGAPGEAGTACRGGQQADTLPSADDGGSIMGQ